MVNLKINGQAVSVPENTSILEAAKQVNVKIPTLCYLKDINEIGACRVCVVEIVGKDTLVAACETKVEEGMSVLTNSPKVMQARRTNVELILSEHKGNCASCAREGNCSLQRVAHEVNVGEMPFQGNYDETGWDKNFPIIRDSGKCIKCMRCIAVCEKIQSMGIWDLMGSGSRSRVTVAGRKKIDEINCVICGQCITQCPVGALTERDDTRKLMKAVNDPNKIVCVQVAPAVRSAWGEDLGLSDDIATEKRMAACIKALGVDYVFDTNFTADLTIMEEGNELLERLAHPEKHSWPMFTSCCPGWVRFVKSEFPQYTKNLSTAKSPQQMFGAVLKSYYAKLLDVEASQIFSVSIMPCVSKKNEAALPTMNDAGAGQDVDLVLTTRELARLIKSQSIMPQVLDEIEFDQPLGVGSGAGVIFGATGGVMEAALRTAYAVLEGHNPDPDAFKVVRGYNGIREASVTLAGKEIKAAIVSGLANTRELLNKIEAGEVSYDFVEVMACPGGCVGGGGQPIHDSEEFAPGRNDKLYDLDKKNTLRFSHENPAVIEAYKSFFMAPLSVTSHHLLHTDHEAWDMPEEKIKF